MQRLEVSGAVRPLQWPLGVKGLMYTVQYRTIRYYPAQLQEIVTSADCIEVNDEIVRTAEYHYYFLF
jgi:hypothetical protein